MNPERGGGRLPVRLETLGGVRLLVGDEVREDLDTRRLLLAVLVFLAVEREVSRDTLMAMFWPDREEERARRSLNQALYEIRSAVGSHWLRTQGTRLRANGLLEVDLQDFERALSTGDRARALALYRGPFLGGFSLKLQEFEHWAAGKRAWALRSCRATHREELQRCLSTRNEFSALALARSWVRLDPLDDEAQHSLIQLLAVTGDRAGALAHFDDYRALLAEEDLRPLDETLELVQAIRKGGVHAPVFEAARREPASDPSSDGVGEVGATQAREVSVEAGAGRREDPEVTQMLNPGPGAVGPRLVRILPDGQRAETYLLSGSRTLIGREEGDLLFPGDVRMAPRHALILSRTPPSGALGPSARYYLRPADLDGEVYVRMRVAWPLEPGDSFAAGRVRFRLEG